MPIPAGTYPIGGPVVGIGVKPTATAELYDAGVVWIGNGEVQNIVRTGQPGAYVYTWTDVAPESAGLNAEAVQGLIDSSQRILNTDEGASASTVGKLVIQHGDVLTTDFRTIEGDTAQDVTFADYANANYIGVRGNDPSNGYVNGQWYLNRFSHRPSVRQSVNAHVFWVSRSWSSVGLTYRGDWASDDEAKPHIEGDGEVYYNRADQVLRVSSAVTTQEPSHTEYWFVRLANATDVDAVRALAMGKADQSAVDALRVVADAEIPALMDIHMSPAVLLYGDARTQQQALERSFDLIVDNPGAFGRPVWFDVNIAGILAHPRTVWQDSNDGNTFALSSTEAGAILQGPTAADNDERLHQESHLRFYDQAVGGAAIATHRLPFVMVDAAPVTVRRFETVVVDDLSPSFSGSRDTRVSATQTAVLPVGTKEIDVLIDDNTDYWNERILLRNIPASARTFNLDTHNPDAHDNTKTIDFDAAYNTSNRLLTWTMGGQAESITITAIGEA